MNNEPVAWIDEEIGCFVYSQYDYEDLDEHGKDGLIPLYTHTVKELHLSFQKNKETGELLAVTYTDDEHRIVEVLWKKPPAKTLTDEEIEDLIDSEIPMILLGGRLFYRQFARAILRKAQENG